MPPSAQIPRYALYGDEAREPNPNFVHSQKLFSGIEKQKWRIAPHRHSGLLQIVVLERGTLKATLDGRALELTGPKVVAIPTDCVHGFAYAPNVFGRIVTVAEVYLRSLMTGSESSPSFSWLLRPTLIDLGEEQDILGQINALLDHIETELSEDQDDKVKSIGAALVLLFITIGRAHAVEEIERLFDIPGRYQKTLKSFQTLVGQKHTEHWTLDQYCQSLGVTPKQLNRICSRLIDRSPMSYVHDLTMQEAKRRLCYSNANVSEVSFDLGFHDPSYFSRFFRKHAGCSPKAFARAHRQS